MKYKHGLAVMRIQPLHISHVRLIEQMLNECDHVSIVLGSIQEHGTVKNPFTFSERKQMVKNVFKPTPHWDRLDIFGLPDINSEREWSEYVLGYIKDEYEDDDIPMPDVYYCGSHYDGHWFRNTKMKIEVMDRTEQDHPYCSGTMVRDMCQYQDIRWKLYVPAANHDLVQNLNDRLMWTRKK